MSQVGAWWLSFCLLADCRLSDNNLFMRLGQMAVCGAYEVEEVSTVCFFPCSLRQNMIHFYAKETIVLQGGLTSHFLGMGVML
jgi:hypothetical protein